MRILGRFCVGLLLLLMLALPARSQEGAYAWDKAQELCRGIEFAHAELILDNAMGLECPYSDGFSPENPRKLRLSVLRIDAEDHLLRFAATGRAEGWADPMPDHKGERNAEYVIRTKRETTVDFIRRLRAASREMLVAVNAQPWSPFKPGVDFPYADRLGLTISGGVMVSVANGRPSLIVYKDGHLDMMGTNSETDLSNIELAVTGFSFCLMNGELLVQDKTLHPRTGYGLCANKRFLFLLVIDGRQEASQGATVREVGQWLRYYGAHTGINMDGGGSSTMVRWNAKTDAVELLNKPSSGLRQVGSNFGVYLLPSADVD